MMMLKMFMPSVPKMPGGDDGEKKEESAESREEAKEQVVGHDDVDADVDAGHNVHTDEDGDGGKYVLSRQERFMMLKHQLHLSMRIF